MGAPPGVAFRPIQASDLGMLRAFVGGLSRDTAYKRLLSGRTPTEEELRRWAEIDPQLEAAVVALAPDREGHTALAGVARYVIDEHGRAELGIVVADAWQRRGLGRALLARLVEAAREHGLERIEGITLASNRAMLELARSLGFRAQRQTGGLTTLITLDLAAADTQAPYRPINCEFHDLLEAVATKRAAATIEFTAQDGMLHERSTTIRDVFSRGGAEYLVMGSGETVRLDRVVTVDGARPTDFAQ